MGMRVGQRMDSLWVGVQGMAVPEGQNLGQDNKVISLWTCKIPVSTALKF